MTDFMSIMIYDVFIIYYLIFLYDMIHFNLNFGFHTRLCCTHTRYAPPSSITSSSVNTTSSSGSTEGSGPSGRSSWQSNDGTSAKAEKSSGGKGTKSDKANPSGGKHGSKSSVGKGNIRRGNSFEGIDINEAMPGMPLNEIPGMPLLSGSATVPSNGRDSPNSRSSNSNASPNSPSDKFPMSPLGPEVGIEEFRKNLIGILREFRGNSMHF
jgi:hypothetical protein